MFSDPSHSWYLGSHGVYTTGEFRFVGIRIQCFNFKFWTHDETGKFWFRIHVLCVNGKTNPGPTRIRKHLLCVNVVFHHKRHLLESCCFSYSHFISFYSLHNRSSKRSAFTSCNFIWNKARAIFFAIRSMSLEHKICLQNFLLYDKKMSLEKLEFFEKVYI